MMNIVVFHGFEFPGGMATTKRFLFLAEYLVKKNCKVTMVLKYNKPRNPVLEYGEFNGIAYTKIYPQGTLKYPFYTCADQHELILSEFSKLLDRNKRNILITGGLTPEYVKLIKRLGNQWEIYYDYLEDNTKLGSVYKNYWRESLLGYLKAKISILLYSPYFYLAEKYMFRTATGISAISPYLYRKASKKTKNTVFVPITAKDRHTNEKQSYSKPTTFFFAGTGSLKDGLDVIAKAFDIVARKFPVRLLISGRLYEAGAMQIKKWISDQTKVELLGFLDEAEYFQRLYSADILLVTRGGSAFANAGFPYKLGEYLATANLVIATKVSGIENYLLHEQNALLIRPDSVEDLEKAMVFALKNEKKAREIGRNGYITFKENFEAERNYDRFYSFILNTKVSS